jgi:hypothetical protein
MKRALLWIGLSPGLVILTAASCAVFGDISLAGSSTGVRSTGTGGAGGFGAGSSQATGAGGGGQGATHMYMCPGLPVSTSMPLITDFTNFTDMYGFGNPPGLSGGVYPEGHSSAVFTVGAMGARLIDAANGPGSADGIGLYFDECVDAAAFNGVTFTLVDNSTPPVEKFSLAVDTNSTTPQAPCPGYGILGTCSLTLAECAEVSTYCQPRYVTLTRTATEASYTVMWSDLPGSSQRPVSDQLLDPREILGFEWGLSASQTQHLDVTLTRVAFVP